MRPLLLALAAAAAAAAPAARAAGGHDAVGCAGCHSMHGARGDRLAVLAPNRTALDPRTGRPLGILSALCLSCHADVAEGGAGIAPVSGHLHHPFSVASPDPRLARVPAELLRGGRFECVGCHDPHPSNPNYRYLRIAVARTPSLSQLCGVCHPRKAAPGPAPSLFTSMDERAERPAAR